MINRKKLISKHNPILTSIATDSPLSVGNGDFAFTADITGMQSLYQHYEQNHFPLCTLSNWGWHTSPTNGKTFTMDDLIHTEYDYAGRKVYYPVERKPGNEEVYDWLRHNPHKFNLCRIALYFQGREIKPEEISNIRQELHLYEGRLESCFHINGNPVSVSTICDSENDVLAFRIVGSDLSVKISFPYGHHGMGASDWESPDRHNTTWQGKKAIRKMDDVDYSVEVSAECNLNYDKHECTITWPDDTVEISLGFNAAPSSYQQILSQKHWENFWSEVGIADFSQTQNAKAAELERRIVLSLYLLKIQSTGKLPPAETGLTVNSWYGRFHTEMYLWNTAFLALWNMGDYLLPGLEWFESIMPKGCKLADDNGYKGIRWPKQPSYTGVDAPSIIAPLLVWQQPHIIYMLEMLYQQSPSKEFLLKYWDMVEGLADFMADFLHHDGEKYNLIAPLIPAQEAHKPTDVLNPMFEIEYFRFGLNIAIEWGKRLGKDCTQWKTVSENIAELAIENGLYLAHALCPDTFENFNKDHPMMSGAYGLIPSDRIQAPAMKATLDKILECWQQETMWGWDFAMMAMCAGRLGLPDLAIDLLLMDSPKNQYVASGNNFQRSRNDLPLYLPGNGSLLLALALILAGYGESEGQLPEGWKVEVENISKFPH